MVVSETLGAREDTDLRWVLRNVLALTLLIELAGFVALAARNLLDMPWRQACWHALFHSVSAYCNAGFSLWDSSMTRYRGDPATVLILGSLIVVGGLGYPVLLDLRANWRGKWSEGWHRLSVHTKLMLLGTLGLLVLGFIGILTLEWNGALADLPVSERVLAAAFHSVNCRTAGFHSIEVGTLASASLLVTMLLMMIGAGPCSTAGGIKVSTMMVLVLRAWSTFRGFPRVSVFRRSIPASTVEKAVATALLFGVMSLLALTTLLIVEQHARSGGAAEASMGTTEHGHFLETAFEVTSALGTTGLTTGLTATLSGPGRALIIVLMFMGRLGPISTFAALSRTEKDQRIAYPNESPIIG